MGQTYLSCKSNVIVDENQIWMLPVLPIRSTEKEILDLGPGHYTPAEFKHCQKMLFRVNQLLGCVHGTVNILKKLPKTTSVMDVGCGAGLFILKLSRLFPEMTFHGVDISTEAIDMAMDEKVNTSFATQAVTFELLPHPELKFEENSFDVVLATMVCHHMSDNELVVFLREAVHIARHQVIINDLHRHSVAYWFYRLFSPILFRDRLITHDGLISIRRGFVRRELKALLEQANISNYQIKWCFPFRWRLAIWKK